MMSCLYHLSSDLLCLSPLSLDQMFDDDGGCCGGFHGDGGEGLVVVVGTIVLWWRTTAAKKLRGGCSGGRLCDLVGVGQRRTSDRSPTPLKQPEVRHHVLWFPLI
ncbi:hypothetical protein HanIR_Chr02g0084341 [Helianthus annuus]|nr:hypothetical protein HanIR_Chr02g0084341 [Helianthus annuus]